jgi:hypothetical protein
MPPRGKRILILESDYMVAYAMQRVLENEGATSALALRQWGSMA